MLCSHGNIYLLHITEARLTFCALADREVYAGELFPEHISSPALSTTSIA